MLKYSVAVAALLFSAPISFAQGVQNADKGSGGMSGESVNERSNGASGASEGASGSEYSPGHEKGSGSASERTPGHLKSEGSAREHAPGQEKNRARKQSESQSKDFDRNSKSGDRVDRGKKNTEHNAKNDRDQNRSDRQRSEARDNDRGGASTGASEGTEGQSGTRGSITSVTAEQKTKIRSVFTSHRVEPARNLNVAVNVGIRLPRSVHLYPVPQDVIEIVPAYRDFEYILIDDNRIAIVDPDTFEVVDIIILA